MGVISIVKLLDGVTSAVAGPPLAVDKNFWKGGGSLPIIISGIAGDTVTLEGTVATQYEINNGTAAWATISSASWTADVADGLFTPFTHIRGRVTAYAAGTITMKTFV